MRSKIITTVIAVLVVGPFAWYATADAVSIKQTKKQQIEAKQNITVEAKKLDTQIQKTAEVKTQIVEDIKESEQAKADALNERQKLEAELGAN